MIFGFTVGDLEDIYKLRLFNGFEPKSLGDLIGWVPPKTPMGCVRLGFDLMAAREQHKQTPVPQWVETYLNEGKLK